MDLEKQASSILSDSKDGEDSQVRFQGLGYYDLETPENLDRSLAIYGFEITCQKWWAKYRLFADAGTLLQSISLTYRENKLLRYA